MEVRSRRHRSFAISTSAVSSPMSERMRPPEARSVSPPLLRMHMRRSFSFSRGTTISLQQMSQMRSQLRRALLGQTIMRFAALVTVTAAHGALPATVQRRVGFFFVTKP